METAVAWIGLFGGLVFCLTGFAVRRIWAACSCAAAGIGAGLALGTVWQNPAAPAIACVLLGGLLAWGGYQLERAGTAAACGVTGFAAGLLLLQCFGNVQWLYALIPAAIGAGSALFRRRAGGGSVPFQPANRPPLAGLPARQPVRIRGNRSFSAFLHLAYRGSWPQHTASPAPP